MLARHRPRLAGCDDRCHRAGQDQVARAAGPARGDHRSRGAGQDPRHRRQEPGVPQLHRPGLLRHPHAERHPAQHPREPGLVHRLHAVPGRDLAGPHGGADQLPDHVRRPHRHGDRQRLAARRSHRRGRGDDPGQALGASRSRTCSSSPAACIRRRSKCSAPAPTALGIELHVGDDADAANVDSFGVLLQYPDTFGQINDYTALADAAHARGGAGRGRHRPARADPDRARRANGAPTSWSATPSASACRSASAARMPPSWPAAMPTSARCRAA